MALIKWPDSLPLPLLKGHGYTPGNKLLSTNMDGGNTRFRRKFKSVEDSLPVKFLMKNDQAAFFEGWFKHALDDGANWFILPLKTPMGVIDHEVHFKPPHKPMKAIGNRLWQVEMNLIVRGRAVISEDEYNVIDLFGIAELEESAQIAEEMDV